MELTPEEKRLIYRLLDDQMKSGFNSIFLKKKDGNYFFDNEEVDLFFKTWSKFNYEILK